MSAPALQHSSSSITKKKPFYDNSGIFSRLTFSWLNRVLARGRANKLRESDLRLPEELDANTAYEDFSTKWSEECSSEEPSLVRALFRTFYRDFFFVATIKLGWGASLIFTAFFLVRSLVAYMSDKTATDMEGYMWSLGFFLSSFFGISFLQQQLYHQSNMMGMKVRGAVMYALYRKACKTENVSQRSSDVLNLLTNDCYRLMESCLAVHLVYAGPLEAFTIIGLLVYLIGVYGLIALGVILCMVPLQIWIGSYVAKLRSQNIRTIDARVSTMHEILLNQKLVKFYAWEESFVQKVAGLRDQEIAVLGKSAFAKAVNLCIVFLLPPGIALLLFSFYVTYASSDYSLPSTIAFTTLSLFNTLRLPLVVFPKALKTFAEAAAAVKRIQEFLQLPEIVSVAYRSGVLPNDLMFPIKSFVPAITSKIESLTHHSLASASSDSADVPVVDAALSQGFQRLDTSDLEHLSSFVLLSNANVGYRKQASQSKEDSDSNSLPVNIGSADETITVLQNVSFFLPPGAKMGLIGPVGSGKSSVLNAILSEARILSGHVAVKGRLALVPQFPFLQAGTVRENILFGLPFEEEWYKKVVHAAALEKDFEIMPQRDLTLVAERGTNLSGGQRQRVAVARAFYKYNFGCEIFLLDSPLSALDFSTANHIMHFGLGKNGLLKNATVILVTHLLSLMSEFDLVGVVKDSRFAYCGPYNPHDLLEFFPSSSSEQAQSAAHDEKQLLFGPDVSKLADKVKRDPSIAVPRFVPEEEHLKVEEPDSDSEEEEASASSVLNSQHDSSSAANPAQVEIEMGSFEALQRKDSEQVIHAAEVMSNAEHRLDDLRRVQRTMSKQGAELSLSAIASMTKSSGHDHAHSNEVVDLVKLQQEAEKTAQETEKALIAAQQKAAEEETANASPLHSLYLWGSSGSLFFAIVCIFIHVYTQVSRIMSDWWVQQWSGKTVATLNSDLVLYQRIFIGLVINFGIMLMIRGLTFYRFATNSATVMHNTMFARVIKAPVSFFSLRQLGFLVDAFSRQMDIIDEALPDTAHLSFIYFLILNTTLVLVAVSLPIYGVIIAALFIVSVIIIYFYMSTSTKLKQMVSSSSSFMLSQASESFEGMSVVRAFAAQTRFCSSFLELLNRHHAFHFSMEELQGWLSVRLDFIASLLVFFTALLCVLERTSVKPAVTGLAISNSLQALLFFGWTIRGLADTVAMLTSVARVTGLFNVDQEAAHRLPQKPPQNWPAQGQIEFKNVSMRYFPWLPLAVNNVSFTINAGEKIGVVGRTGSGKSSLIMALFRMVESENGTIVIDGENISSFGLADLRERLAIIPQEPTMFKGTIRSNLDPFNQHEEATLWEALDVAHLKEQVAEMPMKLDTEVAESGRNFSVGTRQLICLSRAYLRKSAILVLDEATSNLDQATDALVQATLRKAFADRTIITIAHRIHSIIDSDRILAMAAGKLMEFASPVQLLQNPRSIFAGLVDQAGDQKEILRQMAFDAERNRQAKLA